LKKVAMRDERFQEARQAIEEIARYPGLSGTARLVLGVLRAHASGQYCYLSNAELLQCLGGDWYPKKVNRTLKELARKGYITSVDGDVPALRLKEHKAKLKVTEPSGVQQLVTHYTQLRMPGEPVDNGMYRRMLGEAKAGLNKYPLEELKACLDWLNQDEWWRDKGWSLTVVHQKGMLAYHKHLERLSKMKAVPGARKVEPQGVVRYGEGSLMRPEYRRDQDR